MASFPATGCTDPKGSWRRIRHDDDDDDDEVQPPSSAGLWWPPFRALIAAAGRRLQQQRVRHLNPPYTSPPLAVCLARMCARQRRPSISLTCIPYSAHLRRTEPNRNVEAVMKAFFALQWVSNVSFFSTFFFPLWFLFYFFFFNSDIF